jgi:hypothetical protein
VQLVERLSVLADRLKAQEALFTRMADTDAETRTAIARLADAAKSGGVDALTGPVRNIEVYLARVIEEMSSGRAQSIEEIRSEIRVLARTVAAAQGRAVSPSER